MKLYDFTKSYEMFAEAKKYVPNGIYGPRNSLFLTFGSYPTFIKELRCAGYGTWAGTSTSNTCARSGQTSWG
jgi:hypothetical protein